jgi:hypothetical protein
VPFARQRRLSSYFRDLSEHWSAALRAAHAGTPRPQTVSKT